MGLSRFAGWAIPILWLTPAPAWAEPLDVSDPTPRAIHVEFEISVDPRTIGQTYSQKYAATYSATGNTGTVVIDQAVYESAIATQDLDYFGFMMLWSLVAGSASDFTLEIDLTTLEATVQPHGYTVQVTSPVNQLGAVTRNLSTTSLAGFTYLIQYPSFPWFCDTCFIIPGAPYDPVTGKLHAIGRDRIVAPDFSLNSITRVGDLRLSESPTPAVPALSSSGRWGLAIAVTGIAFAVLRRTRRRLPTAA